MNREMAESMVEERNRRLDEWVKIVVRSGGEEGGF